MLLVTFCLGFVLHCCKNTLPLFCFLLYCAPCPHILPGGHWAGPPHPRRVGVNECTGKNVSKDVIPMGRRSPLPIWRGTPQILEGCDGDA